MKQFRTKKLLPALLMALLLSLSACSSGQPAQEPAQKQLSLPESSSAVLYVNQKLGFSMELPLDWMGQIEITEEYDLPHQNGGSCITFYHKQTLEQEGHGVLFFLDCYPGEWSTENPPVIAGNSVVVLKTAENTCLLRTPSDVQYSESDPTLAEAYQALAAQQEFLGSHIKAIG